MPVPSNYPNFEIPEVDLWEFLFEREDRRFPDEKILYQDAETKRKYTYSSLKEASLKFGKGLMARYDWQKGDVLALFTPNSIDTPAIMWGAIWAGGVVSPANPAYTVNELSFQLRSSGAKVVATQAALLPVATAAARIAGIPTDNIILLGDQHATEARHFSSIIEPFSSTRRQRQKVVPAVDLAFLVFSSGTTGLPKGVMLSHRNIISNILQQAISEGGQLGWNGGPDGQGDRLLAFLPFYHIYGLSCLITQTLYKGFHLIVMSKFDIETWCKHIQNYRATFSYVVPPVVRLLSKHPVVDKYNLSSLRMMSSGAAPLSRELVEAVYARIGVGIKQGYGLSETSPTSYSQEWSDWREAIGSVGRLMPNMEAKFMTLPEDNKEPTEVRVGDVGELYLRGPNVFLGYHQNPTATRECLSEDGWFRTGDVGYQDSKGHFYITDRVKELIKYKGFQVAPAELEGLLIGNEDIEDVAVIGVESEAHDSEVPMAFVVRSATSKSSGVHETEVAAKIVNWLHFKVAHHKHLRGGVQFVTEIPKNPSGKILRRVLKQSFLDGQKSPRPKL